MIITSRHVNQWQQRQRSATNHSSTQNTKMQCECLPHAESNLRSNSGHSRSNMLRNAATKIRQHWEYDNRANIFAHMFISCSYVHHFVLLSLSHIRVMKRNYAHNENVLHKNQLIRFDVYTGFMKSSFIACNYLQMKSLFRVLRSTTERTKHKANANALQLHALYTILYYTLYTWWPPCLQTNFLTNGTACLLNSHRNSTIRSAPFWHAQASGIIPSTCTHSWSHAPLPAPLCCILFVFMYNIGRNVVRVGHAISVS